VTILMKELLFLSSKGKNAEDDITETQEPTSTISPDLKFPLVGK